MKIPYGKQSINQDDIDSVVQILKSDWLTQGPTIESFENVAIRHNGSKYALAVNSATSALHIACKALGLSKGDILWTSPNTFAASSNCALYCEASVDFVDIDEETFNMCNYKLEEKLKIASKKNALPKIVVPVHFGGASCDMEYIFKLSKEYGFSIIEDASHAVGGTYSGSYVGSCKYSDVTVFSFHPVKILTTGEGGIAFTNNKEIADKMALYRTHGISRDASKMHNNIHGDWYYEQLVLGLNYRITDIQAALGISQYKRLDNFVKIRNDIAKIYTDRLVDLPLATQKILSSAYSSYHLYVLKFLEQDHIDNKREIFNFLRKNGIGVNVHYIPVHTHPYYKKLGFDWGDFPNSENYYYSAISIPMYPDLSMDEQGYVIDKLKESLNL